MKWLASPIYALILLMTASLAVEASNAQLKKVAVVQQSQLTELKLLLNESVQYSYFTLDNPSRMVVDLKSTKNGVKPADISINGSSVKNVRFGKHKAGTLRVVLDLNEPVLTYNVDYLTGDKDYQVTFQLKPLVVAMSGEKAISTPAILEDAPEGLFSQFKTVKAKSQPAKLRDVVVVIDAGHGGKDPGAIGPRGVQEKVVVLNIAKKLAASINRRKGYSATLIRDDDKYIPLAERREIARRTQNADIFVSIHADSWKRRSAKGASVYALSRKGATSALAKHLASHENLSDESITGDNKILKTVLADLAMEGSLEHSVRVGGHVLDELSGITKLHKTQVEKAAFAVLKSPDLPSILIEAGFISNPGEEQKLITNGYQDQLVSAITNGLNRYFLDQPPLGTWLAYWKESSPSQHMIARGETLSGIAHQYNVSQNRLKRVNNIQSDMIRVGQILSIPSS